MKGRNRRAAKQGANGTWQTCSPGVNASAPAGCIVRRAWASFYDDTFQATVCD
ncbi:hypothetical protein [Myxococcus stipitatus]|uniref:hypothetical protein n=1 Tax=Myxococcus stipitatus TaxID=83455 RepID=UPI000304F5CB|nr:hypothetical protein [Myxococcus stipitatus]